MSDSDEDRILLAALTRSRDRICEDTSFRAYLFTVARHELYHLLRSRRRRRDPVDFGTVSLADLGASPSEFLVQHRQKKLLLGALRRIPLDLQGPRAPTPRPRGERPRRRRHQPPPEPRRSRRLGPVTPRAPAVIPR